jgi:anti-sigma regulatory factor (Ser/Thr protein kinase)
VGSVAKHPWYFETDSAADALAGRRLLERYLSDHCDAGEDLLAASLVYGELISNVIKHAPAGGVRVWLEHNDGRYVLCINDAGTGFTERELGNIPDEDAESGRGLYIIRRLCERVSYGRLERDGFLVRAELPLSCRNR